MICWQLALISPIMVSVLYQYHSVIKEMGRCILVKPLYYGVFCESPKCPEQRGGLILEVYLHTFLLLQEQHTLTLAVQIREVHVLNSEFSLWTAD